MQRGAVRALNINPTGAHIPPGGPATGAHVPGGDASMRGFEPSLIRVRDAHPRVNPLQSVHFGDEHRLRARVRRTVRD